MWKFLRLFHLNKSKELNRCERFFFVFIIILKFLHFSVFTTKNFVGTSGKKLFVVLGQKLCLINISLKNRRSTLSFHSSLQQICFFGIIELLITFYHQIIHINWICKTWIKQLNKQAKEQAFKRCFKNHQKQSKSKEFFFIV